MNSPTDAANQNPAETLREIARELEGELSTVEARFSENQQGAAEHEANAIAAIRRGDDLGARAELMEVKTFATEMHKLSADAHVLRSLIAEIREFLAEHSPSSTGAHADQAPR